MFYDGSANRNREAQTITTQKVVAGLTSLGETSTEVQKIERGVSPAPNRLGGATARGRSRPERGETAIAQEDPPREIRRCGR